MVAEAWGDVLLESLARHVGMGIHNIIADPTDLGYPCLARRTWPFTIVHGMYIHSYMMPMLMQHKLLLLLLLLQGIP